MQDVKCEIIKEIGIVAHESKGWNKELNLVSWNNGAPKLDLREWGPEHSKMGKGVTLTKQEAEALMYLLKDAINEF